MFRRNRLSARSVDKTMKKFEEGGSIAISYKKCLCITIFEPEGEKVIQPRNYNVL